MEIKCELCYFTVKRKTDLARHKKSENCKKINNIINNIIIEKEITHNKIIKENEELKLKLLTVTEQNKEKDTQNKLLQEKYEDLRKIVEKASLKSTKTTVKNNNYNNYLNYISTEPIKFSDIKKQLTKIVNCDTVMYNDEAFHDHIVDNIFKDNNGKDKILCTDINRKNFSYKDEASGKLISDPELDKLRDQLRNGTDIKLIRRNLLNKLIYEYEENGRMGIDPYQKFSEYIQKLNFGTPFVDHVAKKTYVKTKTDKNIELENNENVDNSIDDDYDEEEFKKLQEEFGNEEINYLN
jgi:hypothetical protein